MFGTMIEIPRGALTADKIAEHAEFFCFGTNDLTQMTFGYSRDDAEGGFLLAYVERGILPANPFQTLDIEGVGQLVRMAVEKGRGARPGHQNRHLRRARRRPGVDRTSSTRLALTTSPAHRSASRSHGSPPPRRRSPWANTTNNSSMRAARDVPIERRVSRFRINLTCKFCGAIL